MVKVWDELELFFQYKEVKYFRMLSYDLTLGTKFFFFFEVSSKIYILLLSNYLNWANLQS